MFNSRGAKRFFPAILLTGLLILATSITIQATKLPQSESARSVVELTLAVTESITTETHSNCRYGVAAWPSQRDWLEELGSGWFHDFTVHHKDPLTEAEYFPTVRIRQNKDANGQRLDTYSVNPPLTDDVGGLGWWVDQLPGSIWIVGNEPDRGPDPGQTDSQQDDTMPDVYAKAFHDIYHFIKDRDTNALLANAGLVEVTPGRLQYLDLVWETYQSLYGTAMPVDVWNMHVYVLPEATPDGEPNDVANIALGTDPALGIRSSGGQASQCSRSDVYCYAEHDSVPIFIEQIRAMREWMRDHGQQNKPLILSEHSILYPYKLDNGTCDLQDELGKCFDPPRVTAFLEKIFDYLGSAKDSSLGFPADNNRLVQQWNWYSVEVTGTGDASNLVNQGELSMMGAAYRDWRAGEAASINLRPDPPAALVTSIPAGNTTASVELSVDIRNNGNLRPGRSFTVTFYSDDKLMQTIGSVEVPAPSSDFQGMTGCATRHVRISVSWNSLEPGRHDYWVLVDSGDDIAEGPDNKLDNLTTGFVLVDPPQRYLPVVLK